MKYPTVAKCGHHGFALVVTVSLMVLLVVVSVGLLSLSSIALRNSGQSRAQAEARANAQLALMMAIGELQKQVGPDQRVSASGAILDRLNADGSVAEPARNPHWTGVWDSWKAGPGEASQHRTILGVPDAMAPDYQQNRRDSFRTWLLSMTPDEASNLESAKTLSLTGTKMPNQDAAAVQLVGEGSLGKAAKAEDFVSARLLSVGAPAAGSTLRGRYGWWIGDESQKARIMDDSYQSSATAATSAEKIFRTQAPGSTGSTTVKGLESMTNDSQLKGLPSLRSLDLVSGATGKPSENFHSVTPFSYQVLADVREGGLKRDLSTLLERPIDIAESGDEFMLYKFNDNERVPIQDLAAYFQLYHQDIGDAAVGNKGVQYSSTGLPSGIQVTSPDYGDKLDVGKFRRHYTNLYRQPIPIKVQILIGLGAIKRTAAEILAGGNGATHKLVLTISPSVTLWNPTNLPMTFNTRYPTNQPLSFSGLNQVRFALENFPLGIRWNKNNGEYVTPDTGNDVGTPTDLGMVFVQLGQNAKNTLFRLGFEEGSLRFDPGEVKTLSLPDVATIDFQAGTNNANWVLKQNWNPYAFISLPRSARPGFGAPNNQTRYPHIESRCLLFDADDKISFFVKADQASTGAEASGSAFRFRLYDNRYQTGGLPTSWWYRHYEVNAREGTPQGGILTFNENLLNKGFPGGSNIIQSPAITGSNIIAASGSGEAYPVLQLALMAGCETHESANGGAFNGRKFASRPFLHSTAISPGTVDSNDPASIYNYGWNWWVEPMNSVLEAQIQVSPDGKGYYGGGYSLENGTTHVVQQEIPVIPPLSIAALSHAHLGGTSLATAEDTQVVFKNGPMATGKGGLFPHTLQAIGNSYANPNIAADKAYATWGRTFRTTDGPANVVFADHSYLANKALWDEFFFSSVTPQPDTAEVFETASRSAKEVAKEFFFNDKPLPNRRMTPFTTGLDATTFDALFTPAQQQQFSGGLADKIAAHLMVEGPFNINSTSVDAWKVLLSSLKGKPVAYLEKVGDLQPAVTTPGGTPVGAFSLSNGKPVGGTNDPAEPGQWTGSRELSDTEIGELATAIVRQVKRRGPFLSLSEFVNRRLDSSNKEFSVKGALQAALDDQAVSINAGFRNLTREFSAAEKAGMTQTFPEALDGPIAYGSSAYVDQADILRNFAAQLTPRGDTFVIRTYGDSLDSQGNVLARAWCEAVVQRIPEYVDSTDESHLKSSALQSEANKRFGRKLEIVSFRWLADSEV